MTTARAKIYRDGASTAIKLPEDFQIAAEEMFVRREGERVILEPVVDEWPRSFVACLGAWPDDIERPAQEPITAIQDPFE